MATSWAPSTSTQEIPRHEWATFLRHVSEHTRYRPARVEVLDVQQGDQVLTSTSPVLHIEWVESGTARDSIELELGPDARTSFDHRILYPRRVFARVSETGAVEALHIEDSSSSTTLIEFERPLAGVPLSVRLRHRAPIRTLMTPLPELCEWGSSLRLAETLMQRLNVRHLPIVKDGRLVGILSDRDLALLRAIRGIDPSDIRVEEVMTPDPFQVSPETALEEVALIMSQLKYGSAVIVDGERVVGIFTTVDALRALTLPPQ